MAAHQASPSLGFSRQEHWSGLPLPSPLCPYKYILFECCDAYFGLGPEKAESKTKVSMQVFYGGTWFQGAGMRNGEGSWKECVMELAITEYAWLLVSRWTEEPQEDLAWAGEKEALSHWLPVPVGQRLSLSGNSPTFLSFPCVGAEWISPWSQAISVLGASGDAGMLTSNFMMVLWW